MNYKSLILTVLLMPFSVYSVGIGAHSAELEETYFNKAEELRNIAKKIYTHCRQHREAVTNYFSFLDDFVGAYKKEHPSMQEEEIRDLLLQENYKLFDEIQDAFEGKKKLNKSIVEELIYSPEGNENFEFHTSKFFEIDAVASTYYVLMLVKKYETCLKQLLTINDQLREQKK